MTWRILVADDDTGVAFFTRESLMELGAAFHVEVATSGKEAWQKITARPFDFVISDLLMPGMDGLELLERTKRHYPQTRFILTTAYGNDRVQAAANELQAYRYVTKPFRMGELLDAIRSAVETAPIRQAGTHEAIHAADER